MKRLLFPLLLLPAVVGEAGPLPEGAAERSEAGGVSHAEAAESELHAESAEDTESEAHAENAVPTAHAESAERSKNGTP